MPKIIPLKKPSKLNYTNFNTFCQISLFFTFNKAIKVVVVDQISYLVKKYSLLALNHFIVLNRKNIINAFFIIQKKILGLE